MFFNRRAPLLVGIFAVVFIVGAMVSFSSSPAPLSHTHARVAALDGPENCETCHTENGLAEGCLGCHSEIREQLGDSGGYHAYLLDGDDLACTPCHVEHFGSGFPLVSDRSWIGQVEAAFRHPHVDFELVGKHGDLECTSCHRPDEDPPFLVLAANGGAAPPRSHSFIGLSQDCSGCHQDPHAGGLSDCADCHAQDAFGPPQFDHAQHLPLEHGHGDLACKDCHQISAAIEPRPAFPFPFEQEVSNTCSSCHQTPHRVDFGEDCNSCHTVGPNHWQDAYDSMTFERHERTGFSLHGAHSTVECSACHDPADAYATRYPDPAVPGYQRQRDSCEGCHEDVHGGQFAERFDGCVSCHQVNDFQPTKFSHQMHQDAFPLLGAHAGVACESCHSKDSDRQVRQFSGIAQSCQGCHTDPHRGQFSSELTSVGGDCTTCHESGTHDFKIRDFDHATTGYPLTGAHASQSCENCHRVIEPARIGDLTDHRQYRGTSTDCASCHEDEHRGQFSEYSGCDDCHVSTSRWAVIQFDHNRQSRFQLSGAHALLGCGHCHPSESMPPALAPGGLELGGLEPGGLESMIRYKPLQLECGQCHEF